MPARRTYRIAFATLLALSAALFGLGTTTLGAESDLPSTELAAGDGGAGVSAETLRSRELTVVTTQVFQEWANEGDLLVVDSKGRVVYRNASLSTYHDVDPIPGDGASVLYVGAEFLGPSECPPSISNGTALYDAHSPSACTRNVVERLNLSTGETTRVYSVLLPKRHKIHDVDRINATHLAVADIANHRVSVVDTRRDEIEWQWRAESTFAHAAGGRYPQKWTHINDVEVLPDGRLMVNVRNMDQIVFVEPGEGVQENWTLGADDRHSVLYEAHNPDYIPASQGGPAVLVADSENNRVVEYRREAGEWKRSWTWTDPALQWPRDADRLPNGHTLVTDSNGNRVVEVAPNGSIVGGVRVNLPYEAERLGTGDESAGGPGAGRANLESAGTASAALSSLFDDETGSDVATFVKATVPAHLLSGALFVLPPWIGVGDLLPLSLLIAVAVAWAVAEVAWRSRDRLTARR